MNTIKPGVKEDASLTRDLLCRSECKKRLKILQHLEQLVLVGMILVCFALLLHISLSVQASIPITTTAQKVNSCWPAETQKCPYRQDYKMLMHYGYWIWMLTVIEYEQDLDL